MRTTGLKEVGECRARGCTAKPAHAQALRTHRVNGSAQGNHEAWKEAHTVDDGKQYGGEDNQRFHFHGGSARVAVVRTALLGRRRWVLAIVAELLTPRRGKTNDTEVNVHR